MTAPLEIRLLDKVTAGELEKLGHGRTQVDEVDRLRNIVAETCLDTLVMNIRHDVCGKRDDGHPGELPLFLPLSDVSAGLVSIFARHVKIAL